MVTIQEITFLRSFACLRLDDGQIIWLSRSDLAESGWEVNDTIDKELFNRYILLHQYPRALSQAITVLAGRQCSKAEIISNLKRHHYAEDVISLVVVKLEKEKLLDDQEFSDLWVSHRIEKYGPRRIRQELKRKGIPDLISDSSLSQLNEDVELEHAVALARKILSKISPDDDPRKKRHKTVNTLVRKGFSWETAARAVKAAESEE